MCAYRDVAPAAARDVYFQALLSRFSIAMRSNRGSRFDLHVRRDFQLHLAAGMTLAHGRRGFAADLAEADRPRHQLAAADARQVQQILDQARHALAGVVDALQVVPRFLVEPAGAVSCRIWLKPDMLRKGARRSWETA